MKPHAPVLPALASQHEVPFGQAFRKAIPRNNHDLATRGNAGPGIA